jgi:hypothetical protein
MSAVEGIASGGSSVSLQMVRSTGVGIDRHPG